MSKFTTYQSITITAAENGFILVLHTEPRVDARTGETTRAAATETRVFRDWDEVEIYVHGLNHHNRFGKVD
ncbi:MAG TPA: hypothetical protein VFH61_07265 [Thermoleophilia bacterium]|nr:hypothetical protein [Thermoleophilia bacterium]